MAAELGFAPQQRVPLSHLAFDAEPSPSHVLQCREPGDHASRLEPRVPHWTTLLSRRGLPMKTVLHRYGGRLLARCFGIEHPMARTATAPLDANTSSALSA